MNRESRTNSNRINQGEEQSLMGRYSVSRVPARDYPMVDGLNIYAYGYHSLTEWENKTIT